jgi:hypothetical protein
MEIPQHQAVCELSSGVYGFSTLHSFLETKFQSDFGDPCYTEGPVEAKLAYHYCGS